MDKLRGGHTRQRSAEGAWAWVVCVSGVLSCIIVFGCCYSFGLLFPLLLDEFKEGKAKTAWVGSVAVSSNGIFAPMTGRLCKQQGPRLVIVCGTLLCVAGLLLTTQVPSISWMYLTYGGVFGLGSSAIFMSTFLEVPSHFTKRRSLATGMIAMGPGGGLFIMSPILQVLLDVLHWRHALMAMAGIVSVCGFLGCSYSKILSNNSDQPAPVALANLRLKTFLRNPMYLSLTLIITMAFIGHTVPSFHLVRYSQDLGITADLASRFYLCIGLGSQLGRIVTGSLCDFNWFNPRMFLHLGLTFGGIATLLLSLITSYSMLLLYSIVYGIADGLICCGAMLSIVSCLQENEAPIGFGIYQFVSSLAYAGGPPLGGLIADIYGSYTPAFYVAGGFGMLATMAMFCTYFLKPTEKTAGVELLVVAERVSVL